MPFNPTSVTGCKTWLDFSDTSTMWTSTAETTHVASNNDVIGSVHDKSGNVSAFQQSTGINKPIYHSSSGLALPAAYFVNTGGGVLRSTSTFSHSQGDIFVVCRPDNTTGGCLFASSSESVTNNYLQGLAAAKFNTLFNDGGTHTNNIASIMGVQGSTGYVVNLRCTGSHYEIYVNGIKLSQSGSTDDGRWFSGVTANNLTVGAKFDSSGINQNFPGHIGEVLVYNNYLSGSDRDSVTSYLAGKWGIVTSYLSGDVWFSDTFTGATATVLPEHPVDVGLGWDVLIDNSAKLQANSGHAELVSAADNTGILYVADTIYPTADYEVSVVMVSGVHNYLREGVLAARIQDASNMYLLKFGSDKGFCDGNTGAVVLRKCYGGTWSDLAANPAINTDPSPVSDGDIITLQVAGNTLYVLQNNTNLLLSYTDTSNPLTSAGRAGLGCGYVDDPTADTNAQTFDNFYVKGIGVIVGTGGVTVSGTGLVVVNRNTINGSGSLTLSGNAVASYTYNSAVGSGSLVLSGAALVTFALRHTPTGSLVLSGEAIAGETESFFIASGSLYLSGESSVISPVWNYVAGTSGSLSLSGSAIVGQSELFQASGALVLNGNAVSLWGASCIASGSLVLSGAALEDPPYITAGPDGVFANGYRHRRRITIPAQSASLAGFPVFVTATLDPSLVLTGWDFLITDEQGTPLPFDLDNFNSISGVFTAWVKLDLSSFASTFCLLYYGNKNATTDPSSSGAWDSSFAGVYHLEEIGSGAANEYQDATSNARHGRGGNGYAPRTPTREACLVSDGQYFNGATFIALPSDASAGDVTISGWIKLKSPPLATRYIFGRGSGTNWNLALGHNNLGQLVGVVQNEGDTSWVTTTITGTSSLAVNTWSHCALVWSGSTLSIYLNGVLEASYTVTGDLVTASGQNQLGAFNSYGNLQDTDVDEVRISNVARSAAWLSAEYRTLTTSMSSVSSDLTPFALGGAATWTPHQVGNGNGSLVLTGQSVLGIRRNTYTASGSLTINGTAVAKPTKKYIASGSLSLSGAIASPVTKLSMAPVGGMHVTGNGINRLGRTMTASGSLSLSGSATAQTREKVTGSGSLTVSGTGSGHLIYLHHASGAVVLSGSAISAQRQPITGTGSLRLQGAGLVTYRARYNTTSTGSLTLSGTGSGKRLLAAVAAGSLSLAGTARTSITKRATGGGSLVLSSSALVKIIYPRYVASGGMAVTGTAVVPHKFASGTGALLLSGGAQLKVNYFYVASGDLLFGVRNGSEVTGNLSAVPVFSGTLSTGPVLTGTLRCYPVLSGKD